MGFLGVQASVGQLNVEGAGAADAFRHQRGPAAVRAVADAGVPGREAGAGAGHDDVAGQHQAHRAAGHHAVHRRHRGQRQAEQIQDHRVQCAHHADGVVVPFGARGVVEPAHVAAGGKRAAFRVQDQRRRAVFPTARQSGAQTVEQLRHQSIVALRTVQGDARQLAVPLIVHRRVHGFSLPSRVRPLRNRSERVSTISSKETSCSQSA